MTKRLYSVLDTAACATAHKWWLSGCPVAQRSLLSSKPTGKVLFPNTPVVALRLLSFCGVLCLPFPLYIFISCSYCVCSVKTCVNVCKRCVSKLTYVIASDISEEMFLLFNKNLFIFCRGWSCFQHRSNSEDRGSSTRQLQWKVTSFFSMVLLSVWKTHKWQEDVTLRECILSWNKTQNYAKINKAIFIAESSG